MSLTMYDVLMQLPVFQGISADQLTEIIEKIPFHFQHFEKGEVILCRGDRFEQATFILSGSVRMTSMTFNNRITVEQDFEAPYTMPFYNFFGADTHLNETVVALDRTGIMQLDKANFLKVLQQNEILLVNVLNMLSTHAQKHQKVMDFSGEKDAVMRLSSWILALTERASLNSVIIATEQDWCDMLQLDAQTFWRCVAMLEGLKIVESVGGKLKLLDRYGLRSYVGQKTV